MISITDVELLANKCLGRVILKAVGDGTSGDAILSRVATTESINLVVQAEDSSSSIFVACVCQASTVCTAAGRELIFGFEQL